MKQSTRKDEPSMNKINYQKELDKITGQIGENLPEEQKPHLFLHACCAPCSSYVLEYLTRYFHITLFYYNPNITPETEYQKRIQELQRFIREAGYEEKGQVVLMEGDYDPTCFFDMAKGMEDLPERGERCYRCYELRMREAPKKAAELHADYFTTTLSISPMKNAAKLNEIGERLGEEYGVKYLLSDFKKKNGYKRSTELSKEYGLYRQDYCGCEFSLREAQKRRNQQI